MQIYEEQKMTRKQMTDDIIQQVSNEIETVLLHAPDQWTDEELENVEKTVLDHTRVVLDAVSSSELQSQGALDRHIEQAVAETKRLLHNRSDRSKA
jgi:hypothetical protein